MGTFKFSDVQAAMPGFVYRHASQVVDASAEFAVDATGRTMITVEMKMFVDSRDLTELFGATFATLEEAT